eukprot:6195306-Pleurochrysis_carterae.AAC.2
MRSARLQAIPINGNEYLDVEFVNPIGPAPHGNAAGAGDSAHSSSFVDHRSPRDISCIGGRQLGDHVEAVAAVCARVKPLLLREAARLQNVTTAVRAAFGADWFRLDAFLDEARGAEQRGGMLINEISYPSHIGEMVDGHDESIAMLAAPYRTKQVKHALS